MSNTQRSTNSVQFLVLSALFWGFVFLVTVTWVPVWDLLDQIITMRVEYNLVEVGTKLLLLFMLTGSLIAYRNEEDPARILLGLTFLLFGVAMYLGESNLISDIVRPLFGAVFIAAVVWQLLKINLIALVLVFCGCAAIAVGVLGDFLSERPQVIASWSPILSIAQIGESLEEYLELWGVAFLTYACLFVFRDILTRFFLNNRMSVAVLVLSAGLMASGNSFVHWHYDPGGVLQAIGTAMASLGLGGVALVDRRLLKDGMQFGVFDRNVFYHNFVLLFVVLPLIYGGIWYGLNLILWLCFFTLAGAYLYRRHPRLSRASYW